MNKIILTNGTTVQNVSHIRTSVDVYGRVYLIVTSSGQDFNFYPQEVSEIGEFVDYPIGQLRDIIAALEEAVKNWKDEEEISAKNVKDALFTLLLRHNEPRVADWIMSEIDKILKEKPS